MNVQFRICGFYISKIVRIPILFVINPHATQLIMI